MCTHRVGYRQGTEMLRDGPSRQSWGGGLSPKPEPGPAPGAPRDQRGEQRRPPRGTSFSPGVLPE